MASGVFTVAAKIKHTATVIFLHGLGDTGYGWSTILKRIQSPHIKYVCPTANIIPVTLNGGAQMPAWCDLYYTSNNQLAADESGMEKAQKLVHGMIEKEVSQGIDSRRIILGGFSQGAGLAILSAITYKYELAGILLLSLGLLRYSLPQLDDIILGTPILQCHGDHDNMMPYQSALDLSQRLKSFCKNHEFRTYKGLGHGACDEVMSSVFCLICL
jgi:lysophospholipase-2